MDNHELTISLVLSSLGVAVHAGIAAVKYLKSVGGLLPNIREALFGPVKPTENNTKNEN